ncbi:MAG TPA: hypothetical protein VF099_11145 [Ktedonobacterales bacterium]
MKETSNTAIFGGCLGLLAFVLPWVAFVFILGGSNLLSLLTSKQAQVIAIQLGDSNALVTTQTPAVVAVLEIVAALVILVFGLLKARLGRTALLVILAGSGLGILALVITIIQTLSFTFTYNSGIEKFGGILYLGLGFWFAAIAFIMVLVNSIRTLREG